MRLVVLGGGGFRVPLLHRAVLTRPALRIDEMVLYDVDPDRLAVISAVLPRDPQLTVRTTTSLTEALSGADAVFSAVRVGGTAARVADERDALTLGLLGQETVGAGGLAYGLRSLPAVLQAARLQAELAPQAWLLMFTNPAGMATTAAAGLLGERVIGICDSPSGLVGRAARAAGVPPGAPVRGDYLGINHLGWLTGLWDKDAGGTDLLPGLLADPLRLALFEEGRLFGPELLGALGSLPNEYLSYFYSARELARELASGPTRGEVLADDQGAFYASAAADPTHAPELWRAAHRRREQTYLAESRPPGADRDEQDLAGGGYQDVALDTLHALLGGPPARLILNARNGSAVPQLPPEMIVETSCLVDTSGATPLPAAPLDLHRLGLICSVRAAEQSLVTAVQTGRRADALRAFAIHPLVGSWNLAARLLDLALRRADPALTLR